MDNKVKRRCKNEGDPQIRSEHIETDEHYYRKKDGSAYKIEQEIHREKRMTESKYNRAEPDVFTIFTKAYDEEGNLLYTDEEGLKGQSLEEIKHSVGSLKERAMDEIGVTYKDSSRATFGDDYRDKVDKKDFERDKPS